ncbi:hypothetical protein F5888DRAFT_658057 [Russula emetica]|nr:hypothetical protein F5888DRAFT_658057 [Russula emetica]
MGKAVGPSAQARALARSSKSKSSSLKVNTKRWQLATVRRPAGTATSANSNASTARRVIITSLTAGLRAAAKKAKDRGGAKVRRRSLGHGPGSKMRRSPLDSPGPTSLLPQQGVHQHGQNKHARAQLPSCTTLVHPGTCHRSATVLCPPLSLTDNSYPSSPDYSQSSSSMSTNNPHPSSSGYLPSSPSTSTDNSPPSLSSTGPHQSMDNCLNISINFCTLMNRLNHSALGRRITVKSPTCYDAPDPAAIIPIQ